MAPSKSPEPGSVETNPVSGAKTYYLTTPIELAGVETHSLTIRRPFAREFRRYWSKANVENLSNQQILMELAADLAQISNDEFDQLSLSDMTKVLELVESFQ